MLESNQRYPAFSRKFTAKENAAVITVQRLVIQVHDEITMCQVQVTVYKKRFIRAGTAGSIDPDRLFRVGGTVLRVVYPEVKIAQPVQHPGVEAVGCLVAVLQ